MEIINTQNLHGLYGSTISRDKAVGFCYKHHAHLTEATLKGHKCLCKQCHHLKKHEDNIYWIKRAEIKVLKKAKKELN